MKKPVVLTLIGHYLPGFKSGGPVRSVANLVESLGDELEFRIVCADRDAGDTRPYPGIVPERWTPVGRAQVYYMSPRRRTLSDFSRLISATPHDALYLNSFLSPHFTIKPLIARRLGRIPKKPTILAPRGEFSQGALALKRFKKQSWLALASAVGIYDELTLQASSEVEANDIRKLLGRRARDIKVAMNLPAPVPAEPPSHSPRLSGAPFRIIFLGRISPMKNLDYALRVLSEVRIQVTLTIYGPQEDEAYRAECERLAASLPAHVSVVWQGPVDPADIPEAMSAHDLFFLPTRGENFGHAIAEALGAGTPVLIADTTPWRGLTKLGVGDDLPLAQPEAFVAAIERAASLNLHEAAERRIRAFELARRRQGQGRDVNANRSLFSFTMSPEFLNIERHNDGTLIQ
jgi:glycosyltransferase involved in cell wall biosynthesis